MECVFVCGKLLIGGILYSENGDVAIADFKTPGRLTQSYVCVPSKLRLGKISNNRSIFWIKLLIFVLGFCSDPCSTAQTRMSRQ